MKPVTIESTTCGRSGYCFLSRCVEQMIFREETMAPRVRSIALVRGKHQLLLISDRNFRFLNVIVTRSKLCIRDAT